MFDKKAKVELKVPAHLSCLVNLRNLVDKVGREHGFSNKVIQALKLAVEEAVANIVQHAYNRGSKPGSAAGMLLATVSVFLACLFWAAPVRPDGAPAISGLNNAAPQQKYLSASQSQCHEHYNSGIQAYNNGLYESALSHFNRALACYRAVDHQEQIAHSLTRIGDTNRLLGRTAEAIAAFQQALRLYSSGVQNPAAKAETHQLLAWTYHDSQSYDQAIFHFRTALRIYQELVNPQGEAGCQFGLGSSYLNSETCPLAIDAFERAAVIYQRLGNRERRGDCLYYMARCYYLQERFEQAIDTYRRAIAAGADTRTRAHSQRDLGNCYSSLRLDSQAVSAFEAGEQLFLQLSDFKSAGDCRYKVGQSFFDQSNWPLAIGHLENAAALYRQAPDAFESLTATVLQLGNAYYNDNRYEPALSYYEQASGLAQRHQLPDRQAQALQSSGDCYYALGRFEEAIARLGPAARHFESLGRPAEAVAAHLKRGDAHLELGQEQAALQAYLEARSLSGFRPELRHESAGCHLKIAEVLNQMESREQALVEYEQALAIYQEVETGAGEFAGCYFGMGQCNLALEHHAEAALHFAEAARYYLANGETTNGASAYFNAALAHQGAEDYGAARRRFEQALRLYEQENLLRDQASVHQKLALLARLEFNDSDQALQHLGRAIGIYGGTNDSARLAECYADRGEIYLSSSPPDLTRAEASFVEARPLFGHELGWARCDKGIAHIKFNRELYQEAIELFRRASDVYERSGDYDTAALCRENTGNALFNLERCDEGVAAYQQGVELYNRANQPDKVARCRLRLGDCHLALFHIDLARQAYDTSLSYYEGSPDYTGRCKALLGLGDVHLKLGRYSEARSRYTEALRRTGPYVSSDLKARVHEKISGAASAVGDFDDALAHLQQSENIYAQEGKISKQLSSSVRIASLFDQSDRYEEALEKYREIYHAADQESLSQYRRIALTNMGNIYYQIGVTDSARSHYERAHRLARTAEDSIASLTGLGNVQRKNEQYDEALETFQQVYAIAHARKDSSSMATALLNLGNVYYSLQQVGRAYDHYLQSKELSERLESTEGIATAQNNLGVIELQRGNNPTALVNFRDAERQAHKIFLKRMLITSYANQGVTYENMARYAEARQAYESAIKLVEEIRGRFKKREELFQSYIKSTDELYDRMITLLLERLRDDKAAYAYIERSRSLNLIESYKSMVEASGDTQKLEELRKAEQAIEKHLALWRRIHREITVNPDRPVPSHLIEQEAESAQQVMELERELLNKYDDYPGMVEVRAASISSIQHRIPADAVVVCYYPSESRLFIFIASQKRFAAQSVNITRDSLYAKVGRYQETMLAQRAAAIKRFQYAGGPNAGLDIRDFMKVLSWQDKNVLPMTRITTDLYDYLIQPIRDELRHAQTIIFIPSGRLFYLPLHALARQRSDGSLRFVIEDWTVAYLTSTTFTNSLNARRSFAQAQCLANVGALGYSLGEPPLTGVRREMNSLRQFAPHARIFQNEEATIARALELGSRSCVFIISSHCGVNASNTAETYILLADGKLTLKMIERSRESGGFANMNLVILPNCETAVGEENPEFGVHNLVQSFSSVGAASVLATLWQVSDLFTPDLMHFVYQNLFSRRMDKAQSLRQAQISMLQNPQTRHPFFWGGFLLYGYWFEDVIQITGD
ncbi:MAG: tetratricopeptide repeat protein [bacterium]